MKYKSRVLEIVKCPLIMISIENDKMF